jgi:hypothetical protein
MLVDFFTRSKPWVEGQKQKTLSSAREGRRPALIREVPCHGAGYRPWRGSFREGSAAGSHGFAVG